MARTHGTRSAYNAGCRCEACREASRVARARQRAAAATWEEVEPAGDSAGLLPPLLGLVSLGAGGYALWHRTVQHPNDNPEDDRSRHSWLVAGMVLAVIGVIVVVAAQRDANGR